MEHLEHQTRLINQIAAYMSGLTHYNACSRMSLERDWRNLRNNLTDNTVSNIVDCGGRIVANVNADASQVGDLNRLVLVRLVLQEVLVRR